MATELSSSAQRVQKALHEKGFTLEVRELTSSTRTAQEAADSIGCTVAQIVKSLIFQTTTTKRPILVVASGANRVNEKKLGELVGEKIQKANANFVRERTGFAVGGVAPVGHLEPLTTFIDEDLLQYEQIWAAAGTPFAVFPLTPTQLQEMTNGKVVSLA